MPIKNKTRNKTLVDKVKFCKNFLNQSIGLIFHKKLKSKGLIFIYKKEKKVPLHMIFVFFPIDILYLDKNKKVIEMKKNFRPFHAYTPKKKANYILELPESSIERTNTKLGDKISF
jgi:uncharacterized membrane protein (UPF0127 family)|tara:strand:+ start:237 stop:584 length:348 start_codon:yes stop_codon:yes gene_type:complete